MPVVPANSLQDDIYLPQINRDFRAWLAHLTTHTKVSNVEEQTRNCLAATLKRCCLPIRPDEASRHRVKKTMFIFQHVQLGVQLVWVDPQELARRYPTLRAAHIRRNGGH